jgi:hypothetical protein
VRLRWQDEDWRGRLGLCTLQSHRLAHQSGEILPGGLQRSFDHGALHLLAAQGRAEFCNSLIGCLLFDGAVDSSAATCSLSAAMVFSARVNAASLAVKARASAAVRSIRVARARWRPA